MNNWFVKNISMVDYPDDATVTRLAFQRVAGKPHMVSEYNHPAPNTHAGEGPLFIAAFGALQDWDAIFLYTYSHEEKETKAGCIPGFFSIGPASHDHGQHSRRVAPLPPRRPGPGEAGAARAAAARQGDRTVARKGHAWGVLPVEELGLDLKNAIVHRIALDLSGKSPLPAAAPLAKQRQNVGYGRIELAACRGKTRASWNSAA